MEKLFEPRTPGTLNAMKLLLYVWVGCMSVAPSYAGDAAASTDQGWDACFFLKRLRTLDHLPLLEDSHLCLAAPFDRTGGNNFVDWRKVEKDGRNILLDVDGPGCLHRVFGGTRDLSINNPTVENNETRVQIFLDGASKPLIDMKLYDFYDEKKGPFPLPLIFTRGYPGCMMPIPFAKHCLVQLYNPKYGTPEWNEMIARKSWDPPWGVSEISYTIYPPATPIKSLVYPLDERTRKEVDATCAVWLKGQSTAPAVPAQWTVEKSTTIEPGASADIPLTDAGTIRQLRVALSPAVPEVLRAVRLQMFWDGATFPSVDVPLGYFFGHADFGHGKILKSKLWIPQGEWKGVGPEREYTTDYDSMLMGVTATEAYTCFPMPFSRGAVIRLVNTSSQRIEKATVKIEADTIEKLAANAGRFHATYSEERAATDAVPKFGGMNTPCKMILERRAHGKLVGVMEHIDWPAKTAWWGEGDFMIWSDEQGWPPSYHGVGGECFFNGGWSYFDRKAASGFVAVMPGHPTLYVYFLNDAVQFRDYIKVAHQQWGGDGGDEIIHKDHPLWGSTAFWYADQALPADSDRVMLPRN